MHHLYQGSTSFVLNGEKLKGEFSLVKTPEHGDNAWLLIKKKDKYATTKDLTKEDQSVLSGKTLEEVTEHPQKEWQSNRAKKVPDTKPHVEEKANEHELLVLLQAAKRSNFLSDVKPMLCTLIKEPFDDPDFLYEVKLDGYRIIAYECITSVHFLFDTAHKKNSFCPNLL